MPFIPNVFSDLRWIAELDPLDSFFPAQSSAAHIQEKSRSTHRSPPHTSAQSTAGFVRSMLLSRPGNTPEARSGRQDPAKICPDASSLSRRQRQRSPCPRSYVTGDSRPCLGTCSFPVWRVSSPSRTTSAGTGEAAPRCVFDRTPTSRWVRFGLPPEKVWAMRRPRHMTRQVLRSSSTSGRHREYSACADRLLPPSTRTTPLARQGKLSQLNRTAIAVNLRPTGRPVPQRTAAFTNLQIDKNLHREYLMEIHALARPSSSGLPAG